MRIFLDLVILVLSDLRLIRLVVADDLGWWLLREPLYRWAGFDPEGDESIAGLRHKLVSGLSCPFCVGFWLGIPLLASLALTGGPGASSCLHLWWEYAAGAFALSYLAAHVSSRADAEDD